MQIIKKLILGLLLGITLQLKADQIDLAFFNDTCNNIKVAFMIQCFNDCKPKRMAIKPGEVAYAKSEDVIWGDTPYRISIVILNEKNLGIATKDLNKVTLDLSKKKIGYAIGFKKGTVTFNQVPYDYKTQPPCTQPSP